MRTWRLSAAGRRRQRDEDETDGRQASQVDKLELLTDTGGVMAAVGLRGGGGAHHQRLDQDVLDEFEVVALQLLALGARSLRFLVGVKAEELGLVFELALLQH